MIGAPLSCRVDRRRALLREMNARDVPWNGIDTVEVLEGEGREGGDKRTRLDVRLLCPADSVPGKDEWWLCCERSAATVTLAECPEHQPGTSVVGLKLSARLAPGAYTLHVNAPRFDPRHAQFAFVVGGETTEVDPKPRHVCPPRRRDEPEISYLAKDYAGFRQLILDRLALVMPDWQERHVPDLGITLVELLAYAGDQLSYFQDAVATEAYLNTARQRVSVRRHARLVDYDLNEGCNARAFVQLKVGRDGVELDPENVLFVTQLPDPELRQRPVHSLVSLGEEFPRSEVVFELVRMPRACRVPEESPVKNEPGFLAWLLDAGEWLLDLLPRRLADRVRECAASLMRWPPVDLMSSLHKALRIVLDQDCLLAACRAKGALPDERIRRVAQIADAAVRNRCLLYEAVPHLVAAPEGTTGIRLSRAHNVIRFYTWSQEECCLPAGATRATLLDHSAQDGYEEPPQSSACSDVWQRLRSPSSLGGLQAGDVLILEERVGPHTHRREDADPEHRQAVRLARVTASEDPVTGDRLLEIEWHAEDALRFPLCISSRHPQRRTLCNCVSVALGNVVLVDHGMTVEREQLPPVPIAAPGARGAADVTLTTPFRPRLNEPEITFAEPIEGCPSATRLLQQKSHHARPQAWIESVPSRPNDGGLDGSAEAPPGPLFAPDALDDVARFAGSLRALDAAAIRRLQDLAGEEADALNPSVDAAASGKAAPTDVALLQKVVNEIRKSIGWEVKPHLLDSGAEHRHVVLEIDNERRGHLRFGDGDLGRRPEAGEAFWVRYRVGSGPAGNVGADRIGHLVYRRQPVTGITGVRNPLPAQGGTAPESLRHAKLFAPHQFRSKLRRAIVADDYARVVEQDFRDRVQAARATLDWTGCGYEVAVAVDAKSSVDVARLLREVEDRLRAYRRIGHRVRVERPRDVPLDIAMTICVTDGYLRAHVQRDLLEAFSDRTLPDGSRGFFHPDRFTFGDALYLSRIIQAARRVPGVENVTIDRFEKFGRGDGGERGAGVMTFGPFEIPRLDNDGRAPHNGRLCLDMRGSR